MALTKTILMTLTLSASLILSGCLSNGHYGPREKLPAIDHIVVEKGQRTIAVYGKGQQLAKYNISLGKNPLGHKEREGDHKTPEGEYTISAKHPSHKFYKALAISYPNKQDIENANRKGFNPGGGVLIHGYQPHLAWVNQGHPLIDATRGCVLLTNHEMEQIYNATPVGTKVTITP